jgi:hypothetical protein
MSQSGARTTVEAVNKRGRLVVEATIEGDLDNLATSPTGLERSRDRSISLTQEAA